MLKKQLITTTKIDHQESCALRSSVPPTIYYKSNAWFLQARRFVILQRDKSTKTLRYNYEEFV